MVATADFEFVMQDPNNEKFSRETQTKIRRRAMKAAGLPGPAASGRAPASCSPNMIPPSMPLTGLDLVMRDYQVHPIDLSVLTTIHIGAIGSTILSHEPNKLSGLLRCREWSFFSHLPLRFGHSSVLDDAFRCLANKVHSILVPDSRPSEKAIFSHYGKAIGSLQAAVNDPKARFNPEVLCATALIALFELLNSHSIRPWAYHIAGASRILQLRGPGRFTTDFEKALLVALIYPICCEAFFNNASCFLESAGWRDVFTSAIIPTEIFTDRSDLGISLALCMVVIPGLGRRTTELVLAQETTPPSASTAPLVGLHELRASFHAWRARFEAALALHGADTSDCGKRWELLGTALTVSIMVNRLISSIDPGKRRALEDEAQAAAAEIRALESLRHFRAPARSLLPRTEAAHRRRYNQYRVLVSQRRDTGRVIKSWRFLRWCECIRKKCGIPKKIS